MPHIPQKVTVSIIGLGWLGEPLARALASQGFAVRGSKRTSEDATTLREQGLDVVRCALEPELTTPLSELDYLLSADWVVVNIPPGRKQFACGSYRGKIRTLLEHQQRVNAQARWVFVSSTSVYQDQGQQLLESDPATAPTGSGAELAEIEQQLLAETWLKCSVVRFGGLLGGSRHPAKFLSGRELTGGNQPVNLIHLDDAIGVLSALIHHGVTGEVFNACAPGHPSREQFYTHACHTLGLPEPIFGEPEDVPWKQIDSEKLGPLLEYRFKRPDPMAW